MQHAGRTLPLLCSAAVGCLPALRLLARCCRCRPTRTAGLAEHQLKELAYGIFLSCCGGTASAGLLASLRAALELNETRAAELQVGWGRLGWEE